MALVSAVATLFAALFVCLGPDTGTGEAHHQERSRLVSVAPAQAEAEFSCPYDNGDCGLFPHLSPAVLTVPPPAAPAATDVPLPHREPPYRTGQVPRSGPLIRAPDLHVLQVLRT